MDDKKKYEIISDQLKLLPFLNINLLENSAEYKDIINHIKRGREGDEKARENLYRIGEGFYEQVRTENLFHHCKRILTKDGVEGDKAKEVISGAVVCSLIDYFKKERAEEIHHQILENKLDIEYIFYLESLHRE